MRQGFRSAKFAEEPGHRAGGRLEPIQKSFESMQFRRQPRISTARKVRSGKLTPIDVSERRELSLDVHIWRQSGLEIGASEDSREVITRAVARYKIEK